MANQASEPGSASLVTRTGAPKKKAKLGPLARREAHLALSMLAPTFLIVLAIVLFPLLANFWISVKPVSLADLRAPSPIVSERVRGDYKTPGALFDISYRIRNSSQTAAISQVTLKDTIPAGIEIVATDKRCQLEGTNLDCTIGTLDPRARDEILLKAKVAPNLATPALSPRLSKPIMGGDAPNVLTSLEFTFENFSRMFNSREFWNVFWVTIYYTVFGTLGALLLGLFAAQLLNTKFFGRSILRGLFLFPYISPVIAVAFTWIILLDPFSGTFNAILQRMGITQEGISFFGQRAVELNFFGIGFDFPVALATVIAFEAWRYFPLSFLFILARMQSISPDMYEAAEMDGATPLQQFWHISLPQLLGILSTLFLLRFIWTFNKFDDIFLLTGGAAGTRTMTVDVYEQGFALSNLGAGAAVAVVIFLMLLLFALTYFRFVHREDM
ncbi:Inner membrane ABC transporter permease protein YcjO [hydrothermal vent metagenome]|uniref:Inner membrane ABC transporter permease protein YcjO n=1 Tax=hydrothermal vent metagenome TaxID=652676 RepID=A0A3B0U1C1_9ZZZZ